MEHIMDVAFGGQLEPIGDETNALEHVEQHIEPWRQLAVLMIPDGGRGALV